MDEEKIEKKYDFKTSGKDISSHDDIASKIDGMNLDKIRNLDQQNPLEHATKYKTVKSHMPKPGYMEVKAHEEENTKTGETIVISESKHKNKVGETIIKKIKHDPFFRIDLNTALAANIAQCPSNVVPMLFDKAQDVVWEEKKAHKPEKRKDEFNWWWVVFILLILSCGASGVIVLMSLIGG